MEVTKDNIKDVLLKAKENLWYMAIDYNTGNPVDLRDVYNLREKNNENRT